MPWENGLAKFDLHRHFGGSITPATVALLLSKQGHVISTEEVAAKMVCRGSERNFRDFLAKFDILNEIHWTEEAIAITIDQVVRDLAVDDIDYSEISFSIDKYMDNHVKWTRPELIRFIRDVFNDRCGHYGTTVNLILSLRMEASRDRQLVNAALVRRTDVLDCVGGIDIVGDERKFDAHFYRPIFRDWRSAGKVVLAHAGETCSADNVFAAITMLQAHRVRHGIAAATNRDILAAARDLNVCFDISLHSNLLAGTVRDMRMHHLPVIIASGCQATLGTDDPAIFDCCLADEYRLADDFCLLGQNKIATVEALRQNSIRFAGMRNQASCG